MTETRQAVVPAIFRTLTLRDKEWQYRGEGNANVVLAVTGDGTVLRVMKDGGDGTTTAETLSMRADYCKAVQRLFFGVHADAPETVSVSADELREIDQLVRRRRPAGRRHKSLGWAGGLAAVCPDYAVLPGRTAAVHCVEIKPKQGWLHEADAKLAPGDLCPFCAHQYLKLSRGDVRERSQYCPLDLFSGSRRRVERAVRGLFRTPQNNLKMFRDGVPLDGDDDTFGFGNVDRFCAFVAAALLGDFDDKEEPRTTSGETLATVSGGTSEEETSDDEMRLCNHHAISMPEHCVLHKILTMQKMQTTGFANVCAEYDRMLRLKRESTPPPPPPQFGHVGRLVTASAAVLNPVDGYLVAATARDCSVFVTFCQADGDGQRGVFKFDEHLYAVRVKVSDLDPKPLSTIDKHRKRNAEVLLAHERFSDHG